MSCRQVASLIGICLLPFALLAGQEHPREGYAQLADGIAALRAGDLDAAEKVFLLALRRGENLPLVYHNLGVIAQQRGHHEEAVTRFREALHLQPDYGPAHLLQGVSLMDLGRNVEAARELRIAAGTMSSEPQAHLQLARACESLGDRFCALEEYQRLIKLAPKEPEYIYLLGKCWATLSQSSLQKIVKLDPNSARLQQALGEEYSKQGKFDQAIASYKKAADIDPKLPEIHLAIALIYLEQKKYDASLVEIEHELIVVPESQAALAAKANVDAAKAASAP